MQHINETLQGEYLSGNTKLCRLFVVVGSVVVVVALNSSQNDTKIALRSLVTQPLIF